MSRFDKLTQQFKEMAAAAQTIKASGVAPSARGAGSAAVQSTALSPSAVIEAMSEACKSDNATVQSVAVRLYNLAQKYPNKAYP